MSPDSGTRKIRGGLGRYSRTLPKAIRITTTTWSRAHGSMASGKNRMLEVLLAYDYGGHDTAKEFRHDIEAPFFRYFLHGDGERPAWRVKTFESGSNTWHTYGEWPPAGSVATKLYLRSDGTLSFDPPNEGKPYREYVSDPANPVPYRARPMSPTYPSGDWRAWEAYRPEIRRSSPRRSDLPERAS